MKVHLKTYEYKQIEVEGTEFELPEETTYWFETGIRRSIKLIPKYTTWNVERYNKPEELWRYEVVCVYLSWETKIETFIFGADEKSLERLYDTRDKSHEANFVRSFLSDYFDKRTKEQFEADLETAITKVKI